MQNITPGSWTVLNIGCSAHDDLRVLAALRTRFPALRLQGGRSAGKFSSLQTDRGHSLDFGDRLPSDMRKASNDLAMSRPSLWLLLLATLSILRSSHGQACPSVNGYDFYRLQEVAYGSIIRTLPTPGTPAAIGATCNTTARCNAFTPTGILLTAPMAPVFSLLDSSSATTTQGCDGVYISRRTLSGLALQPGVDVDALNNGGAKKLQDMLATVAAAQKVTKQLRDLKKDPLTAVKTLSKADLVNAFTVSKTPLAQSSDVTGSYTYSDVLAAVTYPIWDSRTNGSVNVISTPKDQGGCGSCVSFGVTGAAEAAVSASNKTAASLLDLSEQWLFFCNAMYFPSCDTGWTGSEATDVIVRSGVRYELNYPYTGAPGCTLKSPPERRTGGSFSRTFFTDLNLAKEHIRIHGSVTTYFAVYNDFFYLSATSPPYVANKATGLAGYHQVLTIGYNDTGSFWIAKNSWGTGWGDKGYFRISYTAGVGFMSGSYGNIIGLTWTPPTTLPSPPPPSPLPPPPPPSPLPPSPPSPLPPPPPPSPSPPSPTPPPPSPPSVPPSPSAPPTPAGCGDGVCSESETCATCPADCGQCASPQPPNPSPPPLPSPSAPPSRPPSPSPPSSKPPSPFPPPPSPPPCGDGNCSTGETCATCPADCGACASCGDGVCSGGETCTTCLADCGKLLANGTRTCCGDGVCNAAAGEGCASCSADCGKCPTCNKNGICEPALGETYVKGSTGCSDCGSFTGGAGYCGDGKCTYNRKGYSETCVTCSTDCGSCMSSLGYCGDGNCTVSAKVNEKATCQRDCLPSKYPNVTLGRPEAKANGNGNSGRRSGRRSFQ